LPSLNLSQQPARPLRADIWSAGWLK